MNFWTNLLEKFNFVALIVFWTSLLLVCVFTAIKLQKPTKFANFHQGSYRWQATRKKQSIEEKSSLLKQPSKPAHSKPAGDAYGKR